MDETNMELTAISTDKALSDILANFSEDFIANMVSESIRYKFRPFTTRMPNHPALLEEKFKGIYANYIGTESTMIDEVRFNTYAEIINIICSAYGLQISSEIPQESIYSLTYTMYQIFVSEFTDRMISFFAQYIFDNIDSIVNSMSEEQKAIKTTYSKKLYTDAKNPNYNVVYDNLDSVFNILSALDIPFDQLLVGLSDYNVANFITSYISAAADVYKDSFASYLNNPLTKTDMLSAIKLKLVSMTAGNAAILYPETNPCIIDNPTNPN
jgi:hypothetical protein